MMIALGGDAARHYWLTQGMARAIDVNISEAIQAGAITHEDLGIMVVRCRMCNRAAQCTGWLGQHGAGAAELPGFCANKTDLETLRDKCGRTRPPHGRQG